MSVLNKKIGLLFGFSLGLSIGMPLGILGIVFGATGGNVFLLVGGIALTVAGFYVMPILWVRYAERRGDRTLFRLIEHEYIYTVSGLALQSGYAEENVRERIKRMIHDRALVGYLFIDDELTLNKNQKQKKAPLPAKKCPNCGAQMQHNGNHYFCEYCQSRYAE